MLAWQVFVRVLKWKLNKRSCSVIAMNNIFGLVLSSSSLATVLLSRCAWGWERDYAYPVCWWLLSIESDDEEQKRLFSQSFVVAESIKGMKKGSKWIAEHKNKCWWCAAVWIHVALSASWKSIRTLEGKCQRRKAWDESFFPPSPWLSAMFYLKRKTSSQSSLLGQRTHTLEQETLWKPETMFAFCGSRLTHNFILSRKPHLEDFNRELFSLVPMKSHIKCSSSVWCLHGGIVSFPTRNTIKSRRENSPLMTRKLDESRSRAEISRERDKLPVSQSFPENSSGCDVMPSDCLSLSPIRSRRSRVS